MGCQNCDILPSDRLVSLLCPTSTGYEEIGKTSIAVHGQHEPSEGDWVLLSSKRESLPRDRNFKHEEKLSLGHALAHLRPQSRSEELERGDDRPLAKEEESPTAHSQEGPPPLRILLHPQRERKVEERMNRCTSCGYWNSALFLGLCEACKRLNEKNEQWRRWYGGRKVQQMQTTLGKPRERLVRFVCIPDQPKPKMVEREQTIPTQGETEGGEDC